MNLRSHLKDKTKIELYDYIKNIYKSKLVDSIRYELIVVKLVEDLLKKTNNNITNAKILCTEKYIDKFRESYSNEMISIAKLRRKIVDKFKEIDGKIVTKTENWNYYGYVLTKNISRMIYLKCECNYEKCILFCNNHINKIMELYNKYKNTKTLDSLHYNGLNSEIEQITDIINIDNTAEKIKESDGIIYIEKNNRNGYILDI